MGLLGVATLLMLVQDLQAWVPRPLGSDSRIRTTNVRPRVRRSIGASNRIIQNAQPSNGGDEGYGELLPLSKINSVLATLSPRRSETPSSAGQWSCDESTGAWVLEPVSFPTTVVHFLGGAGFGTYPRVAYAELLERLSLACGGGVAVACTPYDVALDHQTLASNAHDSFERVRTDRTESGIWPENLRTVRLGHSLGGKLHVLNLESKYSEKDWVGLMAFNNFALGDSVSAALKQVEEFTGNDSMGLGVPPGMGEQIAGFASIFLQSSGLDFTPSRDDTRQLLSNSKRGKQITAFQFPKDSLDSSADLQECTGSKILRVVNPEEGVPPGTHLAPVFISVAADAFAERAEAMGAPNLDELGFDTSAGFSFGDEASLDLLVRELTGWLMGTSPSQVGAYGSRQLKPPLPPAA